MKNQSILTKGAVAIIVFVALISMASCVSEKMRRPKASSAPVATATAEVSGRTRMVNDYTEGVVATTLARGEVIRFDVPDGSFVCWGVNQGSIRFTYHDATGARQKIEISSVDEKHVVLPKGHRPLKVEGLVANTKFAYRVSFDTPCRDPSKI